MPSKAEFSEMVLSAYRSLFDFSLLRNHPLSAYLLAGQTVEPKERGWKVHNLLMKFLEELHPHGAPPLSKEGRRYRLLVLRYIETVQPHHIAEQLAISRRQFYREHHASMGFLTQLLWSRLNLEESPNTPPLSTELEESDPFRQELERIRNTDSTADVAEVLEKALAVMATVFTEKRIALSDTQSLTLPRLSIGQTILRHLLMGILSVFTEHYTDCRLDITLRPDTHQLSIDFRTTQKAPYPQLQPSLETVWEMLRFVNGHLQPLWVGDGEVCGLTLELPIDGMYTILIADDNDDTLALYQRFLSTKRYHVVTTNDAERVLPLALQMKPDFIILDLMMPKRDGWDILQALNHHPETSTIPKMICSVLKQKALALSLGAGAFLEKPFTEDSLLTALAELKQG
jgi:CheY-like chemotaxis protein